MKAARSPQGLVLQLQAQRHVLPLRHIERLLPLAALTPLPLAPAALLGLLDLHGRSLPVLDLQALLGGPPTPATMRSRIAVLDRACTTAAGCPDLALMLQGTGDVTRLPADATMGAAAIGTGAWAVDAVSADRHGSLLWLDLPALLQRCATHLLQGGANAAAPETAHARA